MERSRARFYRGSCPHGLWYALVEAEASVVSARCEGCGEVRLITVEPLEDDDG